jgi:hypothetical protein
MDNVQKHCKPLVDITFLSYLGNFLCFHLGGNIDEFYVIASLEKLGVFSCGKHFTKFLVKMLISTFIALCFVKQLCFLPFRIKNI